MKSALTRAINSKDQQKIIDTVNKHVAQFEKTGFPDDHGRWQRAKDDAEFKLQRQVSPRGVW